MYSTSYTLLYYFGESNWTASLFSLYISYRAVFAINVEVIRMWLQAVFVAKDKRGYICFSACYIFCSQLLIRAKSKEPICHAVSTEDGPCSAPINVCLQVFCIFFCIVGGLKYISNWLKNFKLKCTFRNF